MMEVSGIADGFADPNNGDRPNANNYTNAQIAEARIASGIEFVRPFAAKTRPPPGAQVVKHAGIVLGYRHKAKLPRKRFGDQSFRSRRTREIADLTCLRHGHSPPNEAEARALAAAMASVAEAADAAGWINVWCGVLDIAARNEIVADAKESPRKWTASALGELLGLWREERAMLGITTFRAAGVTKREMTAERKRKDADRKRAKRAEAKLGKPPSREKARPWLELGISRATYNRWRKWAKQQFDAESNGVNEPESAREAKKIREPKRVRKAKKSREPKRVRSRFTSVSQTISVSPLTLPAVGSDGGFVVRCEGRLTAHFNVESPATLRLGIHGEVIRVDFPLGALPVASRCDVEVKADGGC